MIQSIIAKLKIDKSFIKNSFIVFAGCLVVSILNYLFRAISGRTLGPTEYGTLGFLLSILTFFAIFSSSINNLVAKFTSEAVAKSKPKEIRYIFDTLYKYSLYIGIGVFAILLIFSRVIGQSFKVNPIYIQSMGIVFIFIFTNTVGKAVLQGEKKFNQLMIVNISESVSKILLFLVFVYFGYRIGAGVGAFIGSVIITACLVYFIVNKRLIKQKTRVELRSLKKYFSMTFISLGLFSVFAFIDIPLAKYFLNEYDAGLYAGLSDISKILFYIVTPILLVMFPIISEKFTKKQKHYQILAQTILIAICLIVPALLVYYFFPETIVSILYGNKFLPISNYLFLGGLAMSILVFCNMFIQYFLSIKKTNFYKYIILAIITLFIMFYFYHQNIGQIMINLIASFSLLLIMFVGYYLHYKKRQITKIFLNYINLD
jgi:O-antigen/teichoic acid export membrane protein